eukprot:jgi/Mesvir1/8387/Mv12632-RA.1
MVATSEDASQKVQVTVRCRPFNQRELRMGCSCVVRMEGRECWVSNPSKPGAEPRHFAFDYCHWSHDPADPNFASQDVVFRDVGEGLVQNACNGYNCCLFAYGQTGTGKSYSMVGTPAEPGVIPMTCERIFQLIEQSRGTTWKVAISMMEIYNEKVRDLFDPHNSASLKVREHPKTGPYVDGLSSCAVSSYAEIETLMEQGSKVRTIAATNMNKKSSRAHTILQISLTQRKQKEADHDESGEPMQEVDITSLVNLVDLAGSERSGRTGAEGERFTEATHINKSLSTLGQCIKVLADIANAGGVGGGAGSLGATLKHGGAATSGAKRNITAHVPFRDSMLTWLLKESLGGNSKTVMMAAISPADVDVAETLNTLAYAVRTKMVTTRAVVNEQSAVKIIKSLKEEIEALKARLQAQEAGAPPLPARTLSMGEHGEDEKEVELRRLRERLAESLGALEEAKKETSTWEEKLRRTAEIQALQLSTLQQMGLEDGSGFEASKTALAYDKSTPHLVNLNEDPSMSGSLIYYIRPGTTHVGKAGQLFSPDGSKRIQLAGLSIMAQHCVFVNEGGRVSLVPQSDKAACFVNGKAITDDTQGQAVHHGDRIIFGNNHVFRFVHPTEAALKAESVAKEGEGEPGVGAVIDWTFAVRELASERGQLAQVEQGSGTPMRNEQELQAEMQRMKTEKLEAENKLREMRAQHEREMSERLSQQMAEQALAENHAAMRARQVELERQLEQQRVQLAAMLAAKEAEMREQLALEDLLLDIMPMVNEANAMAEELGRGAEFEPKVVASADMPVLGAGTVTSDGTNTLSHLHRPPHHELIIRVHYKSVGLSVTLSPELFQDAFFELRDRYESVLEHGGQIGDGLDEDDPLLVTFDRLGCAEQLVGTASVFLQRLQHLIPIAESTPIIDYKGACVGQLQVAIAAHRDRPGSKDGSEDKGGKDGGGGARTPSPERRGSVPRVEELTRQASSKLARINSGSGLLSPTSAGGMSLDDILDAPQELLGRRLEVDLGVSGCTGLPPELCADVFCTVQFFNGEEFCSQPCPGETPNPSFTFSHRVVVDPVTEEVLHLLDTSAITIKVWGHLTQEKRRTVRSSLNASIGRPLTPPTITATGAEVATLSPETDASGGDNSGGSSLAKTVTRKPSFRGGVPRSRSRRGNSFRGLDPSVLPPPATDEYGSSFSPMAPVPSPFSPMSVNSPSSPFPPSGRRASTDRMGPGSRSKASPLRLPSRRASLGAIPVRGEGGEGGVPSGAIGGANIIDDDDEEDYSSVSPQKSPVAWANSFRGSSDNPFSPPSLDERSHSRLANDTDDAMRDDDDGGAYPAHHPRDWKAALMGEASFSGSYADSNTHGGGLPSSATHASSSAALASSFSHKQQLQDKVRQMATEIDELKEALEAAGERHKREMAAAEEAAAAWRQRDVDAALLTAATRHKAELDEKLAGQRREMEERLAAAHKREMEEKAALHKKEIETALEAAAAGHRLAMEAAEREAGVRHKQQLARVVEEGEADVRRARRAMARQLEELEERHLQREHDLRSVFSRQMRQLEEAIQESEQRAEQERIRLAAAIKKVETLVHAAGWSESHSATASPVFFDHAVVGANHLPVGGINPFPSSHAAPASTYPQEGALGHHRGGLVDASTSLSGTLLPQHLDASSSGTPLPTQGHRALPDLRQSPKPQFAATIASKPSGGSGGGAPAVLNLLSKSFTGQSDAHPFGPGKIKLPPVTVSSSPPLSPPMPGGKIPVSAPVANGVPRPTSAKGHSAPSPPQPGPQGTSPRSATTPEANSGMPPGSAPSSRSVTPTSRAMKFRSWMTNAMGGSSSHPNTPPGEGLPPRAGSVSPRSGMSKGHHNGDPLMAHHQHHSVPASPDLSPLAGPGTKGGLRDLSSDGHGAGDAALNTSGHGGEHKGSHLGPKEQPHPSCDIANSSTASDQSVDGENSGSMPKSSVCLLM